jgi:hypothetical protein
VFGICRGGRCFCCEIGECLAADGAAAKYSEGKERRVPRLALPRASLTVRQ